MYQEVKDSLYYELHLWRLRNLYIEAMTTASFIEGEEETNTVIEELRDGLICIQMAYQRWANKLVEKQLIQVPPEPLPDTFDEMDYNETTDEIEEELVEIQ